MQRLGHHFLSSWKQYLIFRENVHYFPQKRPKNLQNISFLKQTYYSIHDELKTWLKYFEILERF